MRMMIAALVALALSACSSFHFDSQEIGLAHDPETDTLEVELIYRNIRPPGGEDVDLENYELALQRIAEGDRYFLPPPVFWDQDWEEVESKLGASKEPLAEDERRLLELARSISVVEARIFEDETGQRCLLQRARLSSISKLVQLLNEALRDEILEDVKEGGDYEANYPILDDRTRRLWAEEARQGIDWFVWKGQALEVTVPASPRTAARLLEDVMDASRNREDLRTMSMLTGVIRSLTSLEIREDHLYLVFAPGDDGWLRIEFVGLTWED